MEHKKKSATATAPEPNPMSNASQLSPKTSTTSTYFNFKYLDIGNKLHYTLTTPTALPGSIGPKATTPVASNIGAKSSVSLPSSSIKSTILHIEYALPKTIYYLSTHPASPHRSLKHIKNPSKRQLILNLPEPLSQNHPSSYKLKSSLTPSRPSFTRPHHLIFQQRILPVELQILIPESLPNMNSHVF